MKILLIANTLPPQDLSGVGEQVLQLGSGLEARGHRVELLSRARRGLGSVKALFPITVLPRLLPVLKRLRPDVVQVHESDGGLAALLVATVGSIHERRPVLTALLQVSYVEEWRSVRRLRWRGRTLGRPGWRERRFKWLKAPLQIALGWLTGYLSDVVMAPSRQTAAELERDYALSGVRVLPNVMGGRRVDESPVPSFEMPGGYLLYVGRLRIRKAVEVLLESLSALGAGASHLVIVGDGEHRARLERRVADLAIWSDVTLLGRRSPHEVRFLMRRATALVVPSIYEGMPLVILEAMEEGLPVVATRVSGIPEVVEDGVTGWLVPAEDPQALTTALREVIANPSLARERGDAGRSRLLGRYQATEAAGRWGEIVVESAGSLIQNCGLGPPAGEGAKGDDG